MKTIYWGTVDEYQKIRKEQGFFHFERELFFANESRPSCLIRIGRLVVVITISRTKA